MKPLALTLCLVPMLCLAPTKPTRSPKDAANNPERPVAVAAPPIPRTTGFSLLPTNAPKMLRPRVIAPPRPHTNNLPAFKVGPGAATNFWTLIQSADGGSTWSGLKSNVSFVTLTGPSNFTVTLPYYGAPAGDLWVTNNAPGMVYRLKGRARL